MDLQVIENEKGKEIAERVVSIKAKADAIVVSSQETYDAADALNKSARDEKKAFHAWFDPIDEASKKARQAVIAQGNSIDEPLDYVIRATGDKQAAWFRAEQARIVEEKRIAEDAARKAAEDAAVKVAEELHAAGLSDAAEAALDAPVVVPRIDIAGPEKADGVSFRTTYSAEVVNLLELVKAVAAGKIPVSYLTADMTALNGWARSTKGTDTIPGVRVVSRDSMARR